MGVVYCYTMPSMSIHTRIGVTVAVAALALGALAYAGARYAGMGGSRTPQDAAASPAPTTPIHTGTGKEDVIRVGTPMAHQTVESPLIVEGSARGTWFFEASFPAHLRDANGNILASAPATAQGEWMTAEFVPFRATLLFAPPATATGTLVLEKDNPSGLPEHADAFEIPVRFSTGTAVQTYSN